MINDLPSISLQELDFPSFSKKSMTSIDFICSVKLQGWNLLTVTACYKQVYIYVYVYTRYIYIMYQIYTCMYVCIIHTMYLYHIVI